jgi:hypothetical protein
MDTKSATEAKKQKPTYYKNLKPRRYATEKQTNFTIINSGIHNSKKATTWLNSLTYYCTKGSHTTYSTTKGTTTQT